MEVATFLQTKKSRCGLRYRENQEKIGKFLTACDTQSTNAIGTLWTLRFCVLLTVIFFIYFDILLHDVKKVENDAEDSPPCRTTGPIPLDSLCSLLKEPMSRDFRFVSHKSSSLGSLIILCAPFRFFRKITQIFTTQDADFKRHQLLPKSV
jgi:hypothetical protein